MSRFHLRSLAFGRALVVATPLALALTLGTGVAHAQDKAMATADCSKMAGDTAKQGLTGDRALQGKPGADCAKPAKAKKAKKAMRKDK